MHIVTYKNGMSKNLKCKTATGLKHFVYGIIHICLLAIVNVTYVSQCYDIRSSIVVKSSKKKKKTCDTQTKWYFIFFDHGCSCFPIK